MLLFAVLIVLPGLLVLQAGAQSMGISSTAITPHASSILELRTTTKGMLIPRLTTTERDAINSPATGLMIYNSTTNKFNFYNGATWSEIGGGGVNSVSGTSNRINIGGTATDPVVDISSAYEGQNSIATLGTIGTGTWNGTLISPAYGGTGINNAAKTITLGGNLTTAGAYSTTLSSTANTNITLPTSGTLSTLSGTETLANKTLTAPVINSPTGIVKADVGLGNVDNTSDANKPVSTATQTALNLKINTSEKGANNGVATLDAGGKVPINQMASGPQLYKGTWNSSTNTPTLSDGTGVSGDTYRVTVPGTVNLGSGNITFYASDDAIHNGTIWQRNPATSAVTTVNGLSGTVVLNSDNITEGSTNLYYTTSRANLKINTSEKGANNGVATLDGGGKVPVSQLPVGSQTYKGTWDASNNTPTLADNTGTAGWTYRVTVAGSQNLGSGSISFSVGDDVIHNGTIWERSPSSATVTSVNTQTGNVVLNSDNINEGSSNLYFTNARARTLLSANAPLGYNSSSGVFSIPQATSSDNGYLSATDWVTFNQKQPAGNYLSSLNSLNSASQTLATGTTGSDFNISSSGTTHTFHLPVASASISGKLSSTDWSTFNNKQAAFTNSAGLASILSDESGTGLAVFSTSPTLITPTLGVASSTSETITGTGGAGYLELQSQSSAPATGPSNSVRMFSNAGGLGWKRSDGYVRSFASTLTADRTYTLPDANGTFAISASGNIALSPAGNITFTGTLPVANGGTNSSTALNNNRIIVSSSGSIVEASALTSGQLLIGSTSAAPVAATLTAGNGIVITNGAGSITVANEPTITQVTGTSTLTTTSTTDVAMSTPLTATPGAGDYLINFTGLVSNTNSGKATIVSIYVNGTKIAVSEIWGASGASNDKVTVATNAYVTGIGAGQVVEIRWRVESNTSTITNRTLILQRVK